MAVVNKTIRSAGGDYTTIAAMLADAAANKSASDTWEVSYERSDQATGQIVLNGNYNTTPSNPIRITVHPDHRHAGVWDTGKARLAHSSGYGQAIVWMTTAGIAPCIVFKGFQFDQLASNDPGAQHILGVGTNGTGAAYFRFEDCLMRFSGLRGRLLHYGPAAAGAFTVEFVNCIAYGGDRVVSYASYQATHGVQTRIINCTFVDFSPGTGNPATYVVENDTSSAGIYVKNTYIGVNDGGAIDTGGGITRTYATNKKSDSANTVAGWTNGASPTFADAANRNYLLAGGDSTLKDAGTDLSADGVVPITTDILGHTRSGTWDIGAHEEGAGGGGDPGGGEGAAVNYYSRMRRG